MSSRITVSRSLITAMQAVIDAVPVHPWYVHADLPPDKLRRVFAKLRERYPDLERDRWHAARRRENGLTSHVLVVYWPPKSEQTGWFVLMASQPDDSGEQWRDARDRHNRLCIRAGWWELTKHTPPKLPTPKEDTNRPDFTPKPPQRPQLWSQTDGKPRWTWRMSKERRAKIEGEIKNAVAKGWTDWLAKFIAGARFWPGFAGIRQNHAAIGKFLTDRWRRVRADDPPEWKRLPYVTRRRKARTNLETNNAA